MTETPQPRAGIMRPLLLAVAGAIVLAGAVWYAVETSGPAPAPHAATPATPAAAPVAATAPARPAAAKPASPSFDIVRINKAGDAVMAGRAAPGAKVTISAGGKTVGTATADSSGQWVFLPSTPLGPGGHQLTLSEALPNGSSVPGKGSVLLVVPPKGAATAAAAPAVAAAAGQGAQAGAESPVAVLTTPNGPLVMQGAAPVGMGGLGISAIEYGDAGRLHITGLAPAGARLRLRLDQHEVGAFTADAAGHWSTVSGPHVAAGPHVLVLQRLGADGAVIAEVTRDFIINAPGTPLPATAGTAPGRQAASPLAAGEVVVQRGQSLWVIARRVYGEGVRYTIIFRANQGKIRDPNLIYPGQTFTLPAETPSSSSKSR